VKLLLTAAGAFLLSIAAADLKDARVCHWLARKLILRASLRLPSATFLNVGIGGVPV